MRNKASRVSAHRLSWVDMRVDDTCARETSSIACHGAPSIRCYPLTASDRPHVIRVDTRYTQLYFYEGTGYSHNPCQWHIATPTRTDTDRVALAATSYPQALSRQWERARPPSASQYIASLLYSSNTGVSSSTHDREQQRSSYREAYR